MSPISGLSQSDAAVTLAIDVADPNLILNEATIVSFVFSDVVFDFSVGDVTLYSSNGSVAGVLSGLTSTGPTTYRATFTPSLNFEGTAQLYVPPGAYTLGGLDPGAEAYSTIISIDTKIPTATIYVNATNIGYRETVNLVVTFSEKVAGFDWSDLVGPVGSISNATVSPDGKVYAASYYPGDGQDFSAIPAHLSLPAGSYTDMMGNSGAAAASNDFNIDTIDENTSVSISDTRLIKGESMQVTVRFAVPVLTFNPGDVLWPSAYGAMSSWTLTYEDSGPLAGLIKGATAIFTPNDNVAIDKIHIMARGVNSVNFSIDTQAPNVESIGINDDYLTSGESALVTVKLSEPVNNFDLQDIDLSKASGLVSNLTQIDAATYQMIFTPTANVNTQNDVIAVLDGGYTDLAGNSGSGKSSSVFSVNTMPVDQVPPQPSITIGSQLVGPSGTVVTISFDEKVENFDLSDIDRTNLPGSFAPLQSSPDGMTYSTVFIPNQGVASLSNQITVVPGNYIDVAGNPGLGGSSTNFAVDTVVPKIISFALNDSLLSSVDLLAMTIKFSEAVSDFDSADIDISGAAVQWVAFQALSSDEYRAIFSPPPGAEQLLNKIVIHGAQYSDQAGNPGVDTDSPLFSVDSIAPIPHIINTATLSNAKGFDFSVLFDEAVSGFGVNDLYVSGVAGLVSLISQTADGKSFDFHFTPASGDLGSSASIHVAVGGYHDLAGNIGLDSQSSLFSVDAAPPVGAITLSDTVLTFGKSLTLTIHFNEMVTAFDITDIDLGGLPGVLGNLSQNSGGDYLVNFTPNANVSVTDAVITVKGSYTDIAGNPGIDQVSGKFVIDTKAPSATIGVSDTYLTRGESETLTFVFSEAVNDFTANDVRLDGLAVNLTNFQEIEPGKKFTAIYTPPNNLLDSSNIFSVVSGSYTDILGNPGDAASSVNVNIDTLGKSFYGTTGNDVIKGTAGADRLSGVPQAGTGAGKGSVDLLAGLGGADVFVLGNTKTAYYNDGNNSSNGAQDLAWITDFSVAQGDKIEVKAGTYFFSALTVGKLPGTGLYLDTNNSGAWDAKDELIGFLVGVNPGSVSAAHDLMLV